MITLSVITLSGFRCTLATVIIKRIRDLGLRVICFQLRSWQVNQSYWYWYRRTFLLIPIPRCQFWLFSNLLVILARVGTTLLDSKKSFSAWFWPFTNPDITHLEKVYHWLFINWVICLQHCKQSSQKMIKSESKYAWITNN